MCRYHIGGNKTYFAWNGFGPAPNGVAGNITTYASADGYTYERGTYEYNEYDNNAYQIRRRMLVQPEPLVQLERPTLVLVAKAEPEAQVEPGGLLAGQAPKVLPVLMVIVPMVSQVLRVLRVAQQEMPSRQLRLGASVIRAIWMGPTPQVVWPTHK
jgi:hypothetical protein